MLWPVGPRFESWLVYYIKKKKKYIICFASKAELSEKFLSYSWKIQR
jgi:hypothetical protein